MKKLLFIAAATLTLASCSQNGEFEEAQKAKDLGDPISFGVYTGRSAIVKAAASGGTTGSLTTDVLKGPDYGFGVFAYYTGAKKWAEAGATATPDYMWNERVYFSSSEWKYDLVKYWPNDNTTADDKGATAEAGGTGNKISFFAYAPYTPAKTTGEVSGTTTGITKLPKNDAAGDPVVEYTLASDGNIVDLLWGTVATDTKYSSINGTDDITPNTVAGGKGPVNIDIWKLKLGQKIAFNFKHALAKFGGSVSEDSSDDKDNSTTGLQIVLDVDQLTAGGTYDPNQTKVTVKSISIENKGDEDLGGDKNSSGKSVIYNTGKLDLATGVFTTDKTGTTTTINHTIVQDGVTGSAILNKSIAEPGSVSAWSDLSGVEGVLADKNKNVYEKETNPLVFLPGTKPSFKITIEYIIRTEDTKLKKGYSEAIQKITKKVALENEVESNKKYNLIIHLGLTSIKFEATVQDWEDAKIEDPANPGSDLTVPDVEVHLPINVN